MLLAPGTFAQPLPLEAVMMSYGRGALCTQSGQYLIRTQRVELGQFDRQELRTDSAVLERQGGPQPVAGFYLVRRLTAGERVRCRKISATGRVEWLPVVIQPAR